MQSKFLHPLRSQGPPSLKRSSADFQDTALFGWRMSGDRDHSSFYISFCSYIQDPKWNTRKRHWSLNLHLWSIITDSPELNSNPNICPQLQVRSFQGPQNTVLHMKRQLGGCSKRIIHLGESESPWRCWETLYHSAWADASCAEGSFSTEEGHNVSLAKKGVRKDQEGGLCLVPFLGIKSESRIQKGLPISRPGGMWDNIKQKITYSL